MQAVILAGGLGTRLRPVTDKIPKCMAPVGGKPFLFYLINLLRAKSIDRVVLCIGHLGEQIENYFGDGEGLGLRIRYSREKETLLGTGGALKLAEKLLDSDFFVINGDTYLDIDYAGVYRIFTASGKKALIVAYNCGADERSDLEVDGNLMVKGYDKDTGKRLGYVNAGVLALKREVISGIKAGRPVSLEKEVFPALIRQKEMMAYITGQRFYDIGTFAGLGIFESALKEIT